MFKIPLGFHPNSVPLTFLVPTARCYYAAWVSKWGWVGECTFPHTRCLHAGAGRSYCPQFLLKGMGHVFFGLQSFFFTLFITYIVLLLLFFLEREERVKNIKEEAVEMKDERQQTDNPIWRESGMSSKHQTIVHIEPSVNCPLKGFFCPIPSCHYSVLHFCSHLAWMFVLWEVGGGGLSGWVRCTGGLLAWPWTTTQPARCGTQHYMGSILWFSQCIIHTMDLSFIFLAKNALLGGWGAPTFLLSWFFFIPACHLNLHHGYHSQLTSAPLWCTSFTWCTPYAALP